MNKEKKSVIVVPMKNPDISKSRLSGSLAPEARKRLAVLLFKNTIDILIESVQMSGKKFDIAVITNSKQIKNIAEEKCILVIQDDEEPILSNSIAKASHWANHNAYKSMCVIPADLADPKITEIVSFISHPLADKGLAITPSIDLGTNALHLSPANLIDFYYGKKSFLKHINAAKNIGIIPVILPYDSLRFDIDTSSDLEELFASNPRLVEQVYR